MIARSASSRVPRVWRWWIGGKEIAWALHVFRAKPDWEGCSLVAHVDQRTGREVTRGQTRDFLQQEAAVGLPLRVIETDAKEPLREYEAALEVGQKDLRREGAEFVAFGQLLSGACDDRRSTQVAKAYPLAAFPLRGWVPRKHVEVLLEAGVSAFACTERTLVLGAERAGQGCDGALVATLPPQVCPGGGGGEFDPNLTATFNLRPPLASLWEVRFCRTPRFRTRLRRVSKQSRIAQRRYKIVSMTSTATHATSVEKAKERTNLCP